MAFQVKIFSLELFFNGWIFICGSQENNGFYPKDENGKIIASDADYLDSWKVMEDCVAKGLIRSIGISNFNSQQLDRLMQVCTIKPVTNQVCIEKIFKEFIVQFVLLFFKKIGRTSCLFPSKTIEGAVC